LSIKGYQSALIDLSSRPLANGRVTVGFGVKYDSLPQEDFYGLGPQSTVDTHASYERQGLDTRGWARIRVKPWFELRPSIGHLDTRMMAGEQSGIPSIEAVTYRQPVTGVGRQTRFLHAGLAATIDRRDDAKRTRAGYLIKASAERFQPMTPEDDSFLKTDIDVRGYVPIRLLSRQDVFAVRGVALLTDGTRHQSAPFYFLPRLGGGGLLRGYDSSRFIDAQALYASAEYRWQAMHRLQVVSFVDVGQVAPSMRAFQLSDVRTSVGVGIRYRGFRIDYATGDEGGRVHVGVGASF
jgi:outer membrane protein assembly factor BamA